MPTQEAPKLTPIARTSPDTRTPQTPISGFNDSKVLKLPRMESAKPSRIQSGVRPDVIPVFEEMKRDPGTNTDLKAGKAGSTVLELLAITPDSITPTADKNPETQSTATKITPN